MLVCLCSCLGCLDCFLWSSFLESDPILSYHCVQILLHQNTTTSPLSSCWLLTFWHWFMLSILILKLSLIYLLMSILNLVIINSRLSVLRLKVLLVSDWPSVVFAKCALFCVHFLSFISRIFVIIVDSALENFIECYCTCNYEFSWFIF